MPYACWKHVPQSKTSQKMHNLLQAKSNLGDVTPPSETEKCGKKQALALKSQQLLIFRALKNTNSTFVQTRLQQRMPING